MQIFEIGKYIIVKGTKTAEPKFREILSKLIISKYGKGPYPTDVITEILFFCRNFYISEFEKILSNEKSYSFYKEIVWMHEQATNLRHSEQFKNLPDGIDKTYIAEYRRILKMIIEQGCCVDMFNGEIKDLKFMERTQPIINDLLFLGHMLIGISESIAEQGMIEDATEVSFDENNLYVFSRRHHYEFIINHIGQKQEKENPEYIVDNDGNQEFKKAVLESFGIEYDKIWQTIILVMEHFKLNYGDCVSAEKIGFLRDIENYSGIPLTSIEKFLSGMTLTKENKMSLLLFLKKPHSLNKYLYRPFLLWTINQKMFYVFGTASLYEAEASLYLNAIPWGKIPTEWSDNKKFIKYKNRKHLEHDKWLDDNVENSIKTTGLVYQRAVKKLITKEKSYPLEVKDLGEIDFLIISPYVHKVFIAECKHLQGRYDMVNQKEDFDHFTKDGKDKCYNSRINLKTKWLTENKDILEEHLQLRFKNPNISLKEYQIEGIFFINTPTFYMYNSDLRIYTFEQVTNVITGRHIDPVFSYTVDSETRNIFYSIKYPYFRKPNLVYYENEDEDYEVDKYGFPIKP
jgi:hypothetical protein